jgi:hypothetical protein
MMICSRVRMVLLLCAVLLGPAEAAQAQFRVSPDGYNLTSDSTQLLVRPTVVSQPGFIYRPDRFGFNNGFFPYGGSVGGALSGLADLTDANARSVLTLQQARILSQQANQARIDTRRRLFDELRYEQMNTPTLEELRDRDILARIQRSRNSPPPGEIRSGQSLNDLMIAIQRNGTANGLHGPTVVVDPSILSRINLTDGTTRAGNGIFRNGGRIRWPLCLADPRFGADREKIDALSVEAVKQLQADGHPDVGTLRSLTDAVNGLRDRVNAAVAEMTPTEHIRASRFVRQLSQGVQVLASPNAQNHFNGKWQLPGNTVGEAVDFMNQTGLRFAPATDGDEAAYTVLFNALLTYDAGLTSLVGELTRTPNAPRVP